jgi:hypothetical protein
VHAVLAGHSPRVTNGVHDAGVAARGEYDKALAGHVRDQRLVIQDQRVGLPLPVTAGLRDRKAAPEAQRAVDLAGNQQRPVQQKRGLLLLDDLKAGALEAAAAGRLEPSPTRVSRPRAANAAAGPGGDVVDRLLVSVFFGQRHAAARRRLRHAQPAAGVGRLPARRRLAR